jgi:hypothetical protein
VVHDGTSKRPVQTPRGHWPRCGAGAIAAAAGVLTPLELIERLAALIPPPRRHRHRDYGVLAPSRYARRSPRW